MSSGFRFHHVASVCVGLLMIACSTSPVSRIDANRDAYESWPVEVKAAILDGRAAKGMTPEQVEMAMGKPSEVITRQSRSGQDEVWVYRKGGGASSVLKNTGLSIGTGMGGVNVGTGMGGGQAVRDEEEVVFRDGVVSRAGSSN